MSITCPPLIKRLKYARYLIPGMCMYYLSRPEHEGTVIICMMIVWWYYKIKVNTFFRMVVYHMNQKIRICQLERTRYEYIYACMHYA